MNGKATLILISIVALLFIPNPLAQWLARTLVVLLIFAAIYSAMLKRSLVLEHKNQILICYRHDPNVIEILIKNYLILPVPYCLVKESASGLRVYGNLSSIVSLKSRDTYKLRFRFRGENRGHFTLGPLRVYGSDPLGLFTWEKSYPSTASVIILPRLYYPELDIKEGLPMGDIRGGNRIYTDPSRYRSFRNYIQGDDPRSIHWPLSAKSGTLKVKEYLSTLSAPCIIALNLQADDFGGKRRHTHTERSVEAAASIVNIWAHMNQEFAFICNGHRENIGNADSTIDTGRFISPVGRGIDHGQSILQYLAVVESKGENPERIVDCLQYIQPSPRSRVIIITPMLREEDIEALMLKYKTNWYLDFWIVDEQLDSLNRIKRYKKLSSSMISFYRIPEYGDEIIEEY